jgi:hypothetical protein
MRVWPVATAGRLGAYAFDPTTRSFAMVAESTTANRRGDTGSDTVVFIPSTVPGAVRVRGAAVLDTVVTRPDGSRLAYVTTTSAAQPSASYAITVGTPSSTLVTQVDAEATHPLPPISEPAARAMAEAALNAEAHSPDKTIAANAQLVQGLAGIVLGSSDPNG